MSSKRTMVEWHAVFGEAATASVIPYGAKTRRFPKELLGKVPGTLNRKTGFWSGTVGSIIDRIMTLAEAKRADEDGAAVGIYGQHYIGLDIDVELAALADAIEQLAYRILGYAPCRGRTGSVRRLLMYVPGGRITKIGITLELVKNDENIWDLPPDDDDAPKVKKSAVEILGAGQYWNADGRHPSGEHYVWNTHPCDIGPFDLVVITPEMIDAFVTALKELVETFGYKATVIGTAHRGSSSGGARTGLDDPSLWAPSPQAVLDLLEKYRPATLGHDDFVKHLVAIKAALGPTREDYYPAVLEWAPGIRSTEFDETKKRWDSIHDASVGWNWLLDKSGSTVGAKDDFKAAADDTQMPKGPDTIVLEGMFNRYVYWREADRFVDLVTAELMKTKGFNVANRLAARYGKSGDKTAEAKFINGGGREVDMATYRPGQPRLITEDKGDGPMQAVNLYKPSILKLPLKLIRPDHWLGHLEMAFPDAWAFKHFTQWLAFLFQSPGERIGHAVVCISKQGIGKDTLMWPVMKGLGDHNVEFIRSEQLIKPEFTPYLKHQLIICDELMNNERPTAYNTLKTLIANPRDWRKTREMYLPPYDIPNNQNYAFFGNKMNAITMEEDDRRMWVYEIILLKPTPDEFVKLNAAMKDETPHVVKWLKEEVDLSDFQKFDAPMTPSKRAMIGETRPSFINWLHDQFAEGGQFYGRTFMVVHEIREMHNSDGFSGAPIPDHQITSTLRYLDFVRIEGPHRDGETLIKSIWTKDRRPEVLNSKGEWLIARWKADQSKKKKANF